jgi:hypothetical protein
MLTEASPMTRFLTPSEAGKMSEEENETFAAYLSDINNFLTRDYVPGAATSIRISLGKNVTLRVQQKIKNGLEAAGWNAVFYGLELQITDKQKSSPVIVDKRAKN